MLEGMRAASQTWIGRTIMTVVMGVIILSFAIWGIGDIFSNFGANTLAKVGSAEITVEDYRNAYQVDLQRMQRQARRAITNDEARRLGLESQTLGRLLSEAELDQKAKALDLAISDQDIAKRIVTDDSFKGITGKFDPVRFAGILRDNGLTERSFVASQRGVYLRQEISDAAIANLGVPRAMAEAINRFQNETRSVDYVVLPAAAAGDIPEPSAEELQKYYDTRKLYYQTFEYRKLVTLAVTPDTVAKADEVSDADAQKRYDEVKAERYSTPERRTIEQVSFPDAAAAAAAKAKLDGGETFDALLTELKTTPKDVELGTMTRDALVDKAVADAAFALPDGGVSAPVAAQFGTVLLRVTKIEPAAVKPFSEAAPELKREIALQRSRADIDKLHDAIEDQRSSGKTLPDAAKAVGLEARTIDAVTAAGRDKAGKPVADIPGGPALLKAAFASDVGVDNDTLSLPGGGYAWFEVLGTEPERQQPLDEVKASVEKNWRDDETAKRLAAKTAELAKKIEAGEPIATIAAAENNLEVQHASAVKRDGTEGLSAAAVTQIFNVGVNGAGSAADGSGRILFHVLDAVVPPLDDEKPDFKALMEQVKAGIADDVLSGYLGKLRTDFGVSINTQALQAATGTPGN